LEVNSESAEKSSRTYCKKSNNPATSEVGSISPTDYTSGHYMAALKAKNRDLMELVKSMQAARTPEANNKATDDRLSTFNPDGAGADASARL